MLFLNANIRVFSLTLARSACVDHSWYQELNLRVPIFKLYMIFVDSNCDCVGMKCFSNTVLKSAHVPKSTRVAAMAVFCLSHAHSPAGVPILKKVRAVAIFLFSSVNRVLFR
jgi:hypothetical protein